MTSSGDQGLETFGKYAIEYILGRGGYSTVYRAELRGDYGFRKPVALKVMRHRLDHADEPATKDFLNEARLGAAVRHANLVEFYECGRVGNSLYIALELVEGPTLAEFIKVAPTLGLEAEDSAVLSVAMQSALGLRALHSAKVDGLSIHAIHRDFKPGNILLSASGEVKLTDYGITRYATDGYQTIGAGGPLGSPLYMSPEQARGEELTQASDIFSFGTSVLELITGRPVFGATTIEGIVHQVGRADVSEALTEARERFPHLVQILENCLLAEPQNRFPDGAALVEGLKDATPPAFAEEELGTLAQEVYRAVEFKRRAARKRPVRKFWNSLSDDEDSVSIEIQPGFDSPSTGGSVEPLAAFPGRPTETMKSPVPGESVEVSTAGEPPAAAAETLVESGDEPPLPPMEDKPGTAQEAVPRGHRGVWISIGVLCVVVTLAVVWRLAPWTPEDESRGATVDDGAGVGSHAADAGPAVESVSPTGEETQTNESDRPAVVAEEQSPPPEPRESVDEPATEPPLEVSEPPTTPSAPATVVLTHTPVQRGIRGRSITLPASVDPAGQYRFTLWYRAAPDGVWNRQIVEDGAQGEVSLTLPAGAWIAANQQTVDYFIEVDTAGGVVRTGSAANPHQLTLY